MIKQSIVYILLTGLVFISCNNSSSEQNKESQNIDNKESSIFIPDSVPVYQSENLIINQLSEHIYEHISFLDTDDYGKVGCNGMLIIHENEGVIFDTPTENQGSLELINFITQDLKSDIKAIIPTHFHEDCIGGIQQFEEHSIPIYVTKQTLALFNENGQDISDLVHEFDTLLTLNLGTKKVYAQYFGEGHTKDNIVGCFPEDNAVFGGCLIKRVNSSKGYLGDASLNDWSETVRKVKLNYPKAEIVIPGHGKWGGTELFDYTIELFKVE